MENASKALTIAGEVLLGVLILSLLVTFYYKFRSYQSEKETDDLTLQSAKFNKQYDMYVRDIYGTELLSLAYKIQNYEKTESDQEGYTKIDFSVTFKTELGEVFKKNENLTETQIIDRIEELQKYIKVTRK